MTWKKRAGFLAAAVLLFSGCGVLTQESVEKGQMELQKETVDNEQNQGQQEIVEKNAVQTEEKIQFICATFPEYDWVRQILGENIEKFELTLLVQNGMDLHSYQPSAEDMIKISDCDAFLYTGGISESWVEDVRRAGQTEQKQVLNLLEVIEEQRETEEMAEDTEHVHEGEVHAALDEHIWLSLKNAEILVEEIQEFIIALDGEGAEVYKTNAQNYKAQLAKLDQAYQEVVDVAEEKTLLFADRFPFRYLTEDYGLTYYAAFTGCSAETEASFETITFLAEKVDERKLPAVLTIENSDSKIAKTIIENTEQKNQQILVMNSLQSLTKQDMENGVTYLSVMEENLQILKQALR